MFDFIKNGHKQYATKCLNPNFGTLVQIADYVQVQVRIPDRTFYFNRVGRRPEVLTVYMSKSLPESVSETQKMTCPSPTNPAFYNYGIEVT